MYSRQSLSNFGFMERTTAASFTMARGVEPELAQVSQVGDFVDDDVMLALSAQIAGR